MAHALLSPSSAHRWLVCTPSARLAEMLPEPKRKGGFDHAKNGTTAHEYAEAQLKRYYKQITATEYNEAVRKVKDSEFYSDEFEEYVAQYVLYVRSQMGEATEPHFEMRVDYSQWVPHGFGTSDVILIEGDTIHVIDAKFGVMIVDAQDNAQMRLYALGAYNIFKASHPNLKHVVCTIVQPRVNNISTEEITVSELLNWAETVVKPQALKADKGEGEFVAGDHCTFCKAKAQCRARSEFMQAAVADDFRPPATLSDAELTKTFRRIPQIKAWLKDVEEYLLNQAVNGAPLPGFTLGKTSTKRRIEDQELAKIKLVDAGFDEDELFEPATLKSVAQLEKIVGKEELKQLLGQLIVKPEGEHKLVEDKTKEDFS